MGLIWQKLAKTENGKYVLVDLLPEEFIKKVIFTSYLLVGQVFSFI